MSFQSLLKKEKSTSSEMKYWNILVPNLALISDGDWSQRKGCSPLLPCIEIAQISSDSEGFDPSDYSLEEHIAHMPSELFSRQILRAIDQGKLDSMKQFSLILSRLKEKPNLLLFEPSDEEYWEPCY